MTTLWERWWYLQHPIKWWRRAQSIRKIDGWWHAFECLNRAGGCCIFHVNFDSEESATISCPRCQTPCESLAIWPAKEGGFSGYDTHLDAASPRWVVYLAYGGLGFHVLVHLIAWVHS